MCKSYNSKLVCFTAHFALIRVAYLAGYRFASRVHRARGQAAAPDRAMQASYAFRRRRPRRAHCLADKRLWRSMFTLSAQY